MVNKPFFSVVIPTYNRVLDLQFALFCLKKQTFKDFEIVISDNCSNDGTEEMIEKLKDKKIKYSKTKEILGNAKNMKRAIEKAKGEYIFLHSDDDFLFSPNSLNEIVQTIKKYKPGFLRLNYVSLSLNKDRIFSYKVRKSFSKNTYLPPQQQNNKVLSFILEADPYFISGIIFKNKIPKSIKMIDSDPAPWINILFYSTQKFGAYFLIKHHLIACWSRRKTAKNVDHHIFTLIDGKLRSEKYLDEVKNKIDRNDYQKFLHDELILLYVTLLPAVKFNVGNKNMIKMAKRICSLDPAMERNISYKIYFYISLIMPGFVLKLARDIFLNSYFNSSNVKSENQLVDRLKNLEDKYLKSRNNALKIKEKVFNFS